MKLNGNEMEQLTLEIFGMTMEGQTKLSDFDVDDRQ